MSVPGIPLSEVNRRNINRMADGLLPLSDWIREKKFHPPDDSLPWRNGKDFTAEKLGFSQFFEGLLIETSGDSDLKARWDRFEADPLHKCPIQEIFSWRSIRGLSPTPSFSPALSDNVLVDIETRTVSRAEFYFPYWSLLATAFEALDRHARLLGEPADDVSFSLRLLKNEEDEKEDEDKKNKKEEKYKKTRFWPDAGQVKASRFCSQFVKDVLYCYLGLRNPIDEPWRHAVLIEVGEQRRVGNKYSREDCKKAVDKFNEVFDERMKIKPERAIREESEREFFSVPVGSPPVNSREFT